MQHTPVAVALVALALLPACAVDTFQDFTETFLITDPVERFEIVVDRGSLVATAYDLHAVKLKRHTFGLASSLGTPDYSVADGVVRFEAHCSGRRDECTWDHMLELPLGIGFDLNMVEALITLGDIDGDVTATFDTGRFRGYELRSAHLTISAAVATINVDFAAAPESVSIDLDDGEVALQVPAGSYRCVFAGAPAVSGITCDDAAAATLDVDVGVGSLTVTGVAP